MPALPQIRVGDPLRYRQRRVTPRLAVHLSLPRADDLAGGAKGHLVAGRPWRAAVHADSPRLLAGSAEGVGLVAQDRFSRAVNSFAKLADAAAGRLLLLLSVAQQSIS